MPINKYGIQVHSANDPDYFEWIHPNISERPPYLHPQYRTGRWTMIDGVKIYSLRKVENGVHHGSQIYHNAETGNNRLYIIGSQVREQRRQAALIHGEDSEKVQKIGRDTFRIYRQEGHDFRTYGTKPEFNGYDLKSKWKITDYASAEHNEEVLELTGDRTGNTIDQDLKFHFTRFEGNSEEALKDVERYKYYFKLASVRYNPKVDKATHRNSRRFWEGLRDEQQRDLENELLREYDNIEIEIPDKTEVEDQTSSDNTEVKSDVESDASMDTVIDVSLEVNVDHEQKVSFSKSFSDDSLKDCVDQPTPIINLKDFVRESAPQAPGILSSSLILGKVLSEVKDTFVIRKRTRIPRNIMNQYSSSSLSTNQFSSLSSDVAATAAAAAASNEAQSIKFSKATEEEEVFPPPPQFFTPPPQPMLVTAPVSINFELSESAPTVTPPTPFINKIDEILEEVDEMVVKVSSKLAGRETPPPKMMSLAAPTYKSITIDSDDVWEDSKEDLQAQNEEYHEGAQIDQETIRKQEVEISRHKKVRRTLETNINTLRVAGSAMSLIINDALQKFNTPRFDMDLSVSIAQSSTSKRPKVNLKAGKSNLSDSNCLMSPICDTDSLSRCTHCELQWAASVISVIWNDAMQTANLTDSDFIIDHFNPRVANGPPPDYFSKPGEVTLTELENSLSSTKRGCEGTPEDIRSRRRRIDSEEASSTVSSIDRESLEIKREVVVKYRVETEYFSDEEDWTRMAVPEFIELPESENGDSNY